ncbi:MAG: hypothetical protein ACXVCE_13520, partial [Bacteriovorax sp.]
MKTLALFLFLMALIAGPLAHAEGLTTTTTAHGYDRKDFCESGAKNQMADLDKSSTDQMTSINQLKNKVNDLTARKNLISGFLQLSEQFKNSYESLSSNQDPLNKDLTLKLTDFKTLLRSSLTLSALSMIVKADPKAAAKNSITELCKAEKNSATNLCNYINHEKTITVAALSPEIKNLNNTISNVNAALSKNADAASLKNDLEVVYASIEPDKVFGDLVNHSPILVKVLAQNDKDNLLDCLNDNDSSCKKLLSNADHLKTILTTEMSDIHSVFSKQKVDEVANEYKTASKMKDEQIKDLIKQKSAEAITYIEGDDSNQKDKRLKIIGFSKEDYSKYKAACTNQSEENNALCKQYSKNIISRFEDQNKQLENDIKKTMQDLDNAVADNSQLEINEKLKQYVAEKYLRSCKNASLNDISSAHSTPCADNLTANFPGDTGEIDQMQSKLSSIIGKLKSTFTPSSKRGELGPFSKDELKGYKNYCQNTSAKDKYKDICDDIFIEARSIENEKESKEWDDFNKQYWVEHNPRSKN